MPALSIFLADSPDGYGRYQQGRAPSWTEELPLFPRFARDSWLLNPAYLDASAPLASWATVATGGGLPTIGVRTASVVRPPVTRSPATTLT